MDTGLLTQAVLTFQQAAAPWAVALIPIMEGLLFKLVFLQWSLCLMAWIFKYDLGDILSTMVQFLVTNGIVIYAVRHGHEIIAGLFQGIVHLASLLGAPPLDPSAIASYGVYVVDPIAKALADQGWLSFATHPATYFFGVGAVWCLLGAFIVLAFLLVGVLILSFFLSGAAPFFLTFAALGFSRSITMGYLRLCFGAMVGLFTLMLMAAILVTLGEVLAAQIRDQFLTPVATLTYVDFLQPLVVGLILIGVFVWIPLSIMRHMDGIVLEWAGSRTLRSLVFGASYSVGQAIGSHSGGSGSDNERRDTGSSHLPLPPPSAGAGQQQQQTQRSGAWGSRR